MAFASLWACTFRNEIEVPEIDGRLGFPLQTYHEIEGIMFLDYFGDQKPALLVTKIDKTDLEHVILIAIEGIDEKISAADYKFGGYEKCIYVGTPKDVLEKSPSLKKKRASDYTFFDPRRKKPINHSELKNWFIEPQEKVWERQKKTISHGYFTSTFQVTDLIHKNN
ncbi:MAG: hypothetical protein ACSHYA_19085 [Opitutaceae bacterium]